MNKFMSIMMSLALISLAIGMLYCVYVNETTNFLLFTTLFTITLFFIILHAQLEELIKKIKK